MRLVLGLVLLLPCLAVHAQSAPQMDPPGIPAQVSAGPSADSLLLSGEMDHFSATGSGVNGSLDWIHNLNSGASYSAGVSSFSVPETRWSYGKIAAAVPVGSRFLVLGGANVGAGNVTGTGFTYQTYTEGLRYTVDKRVYLMFSEEYLHVDQTDGHLLKPEAVVVLAPRLAIDSSYTHSLGGNFQTAFGSARMDLNVRRVRLIGGGAFGHTIPQLVNDVVEGAPVTDSIQEGFVGCAFPFSGGELTVISDFYKLAEGFKNALSFSIKFPLPGMARERR